MGSYMLIAFVLGFWCIWSANRDVNSLWEALVFTILSVIIRGFMDWTVPELDNVVMVAWGLLFVYVVCVLEAVDRFSRTMAINMVVAVVGAVGWFFLARHLLGEAGADMIKGWIG